MFIVPTSSTKRRCSASSQRTWSNPMRLGLLRREEARRVVGARFRFPRPPAGRPHVRLLDEDADGVEPPRVVRPHRAGDDEEEDLRRRADAQPGFGRDHRGTDVQGGPLAPRDPLPVEPHQVPEGVRAGPRPGSPAGTCAPPSGSGAPRSGRDGRGRRRRPARSTPSSPRRSPARSAAPSRKGRATADRTGRCGRRAIPSPANSPSGTCGRRRCSRTRAFRRCPASASCGFPAPASP